jgi:hypothetical protein
LGRWDTLQRHLREVHSYGEDLSDLHALAAVSVGNTVIPDEVPRYTNSGPSPIPSASQNPVEGHSGELWDAMGVETVLISWIDTGRHRSHLSAPLVASNLSDTSDRTFDHQMPSSSLTAGNREKNCSEDGTRESPHLDFTRASLSYVSDACMTGESYWVYGCTIERLSELVTRRSCSI